MAGALYERTARLTTTRIATGNTAIDGTGSLTSLLTAVAAGTRIKSVTVTPIATITDGWIAFFIYDGSNNRFIGVLPVNAFTVTAPIKPPTARQFPLPFDVVLPSSSHILKACPYNSESFDVAVTGADFA